MHSLSAANSRRIDASNSSFVMCSLAAAASFENTVGA